MTEHLNRARKLTKLLDDEFKFLGFKFGLDPILGLIPGLGDIIAAILAGYIIWIAYQAKVPTKTLLGMFAYVILDFALGFVPIIGDAADFFFKSNTRNLKLLEQHYA